MTPPPLCKRAPDIYGARIDRTFVVDSLSPFGSVGVDERGGLHCREILRCALAMLAEHNTKYPDDLWPAPEHLWVVMKNSELSTYAFLPH